MEIDLLMPHITPQKTQQHNNFFFVSNESKWLWLEADGCWLITFCADLFFVMKLQC